MLVGFSKPKPAVSIPTSEGTPYNINDNTRQDYKADPTNHPKGINRLSSKYHVFILWIILTKYVVVVAGLIQSENVAAVALKNSDKQADDSGLESGHTSMNNCKFLIIIDIKTKI